ncbi:MAG TPA: type II secretion system F family protein [Solimonas sp.]|nr:type II secretion system F family protein [Solimonas sp.]
MSPTLFASLVAFVILVVTAGIGAFVVLLLRGRRDAHLRSRLVADSATPDFEGPAQKPLLQTMAKGGQVMEQWVDTEGETGRLLLQAGWRGTEARLLWYAFQALLPLVFGGLVLAFWLFGEAEHKGLMLLLYGFAGAALAFLMPRWILRGVAGARCQRIKSEVPLFIHLLVLLFEAGLSTRQALSSLVREGKGVLPELGREFDLALRQFEAGADTGEVLKNMAEALAVDDFSSVIGVLRQVDRYGGEVREPLLEALEVMEERRSLDLRERVNLLSGRMTVVMVLFFFPALLIFVAGPAFLSIIRALREVGGGGS